MKTKKPTSPQKGSTQDFIEIDDVKDDIVILKGGGACVIIQSGTVNFGLLSEDEQIAMITSYASLLNSLSFPVQIAIVSRKMDISSYMEFIEGKIQSQKGGDFEQPLTHYREFIKNLVKKNEILEKKFYFVIPFSSFELGPTGGRMRNYSREYISARAKTSLYPKRDHLIRLLKKTGISGKVLGEQEIIELFYNLYNPSAVGRKLESVSHYKTLVHVAEQNR
ncbi:MAG TPA: hypothetical protein VJH96_02775 [Patescibacteria group bacterium]|nr:hypothetical protein [Patescibacteria group bacterium]